MAAKTVTVEFVGGNPGGRMTKYLNKLRKSLGNGAQVKVGFFESETYPQRRYHFSKKRLAGMSPEAQEFAKFLEGKERFSGPVAQVAFWNEFGTKTAPPRPFMRSTVAKRAPKWGKQLGVALIHTKYNAEEALRIMGETMQDQVRASITEWRDPANSPLTAALKGRNKPLIDSGTLLKAVEFQVLDDLED